MELKRVCAWCRRFLGGRRSSPHVSHGVCPPCAWAQLVSIGRLPGEPSPADPWQLWVDIGGEG